MITVNSNQSLMMEIMAALVLFILSLLVVVGTVLKIIGEFIHLIAIIVYYVIELIERCKHRRAAHIKSKQSD